MELTTGYHLLITTIILLINNLGLISSQNQNIQHKGGGTSFTNIQIYQQNDKKNGFGFGNSGNSGVGNGKKTLVNIVNKIKHPQEYSTGPQAQNFLPNGKPLNQNYQSSYPENNQNFNRGPSSNYQNQNQQQQRQQQQQQQQQKEQQQQQQIQPSQITYIYNIPQNQQYQPYQQEDRSNPYEPNRENYQQDQNHNQNYQQQHQQHQTDQQIKLYSASAGTHRPASFQQQQQQHLQQQQYELQSNIYSENQGPLISRQQRQQSRYNGNENSNEYQQQGQAFVNQFEVPTTNFDSNNQQQEGEYEIKFQTGPVGDISHLNYDDQQQQQVPNSPHFGPPTSQELQSQPISFKSNIIPEFTTNVQGPSSFPPPTSSSGHAYTPNGHLLVPVSPPPLTNLLKQGQVLQENVYGAPNQNQGYSSNGQNQGYSNGGQNQGYSSGPSGQQQQQYGNPSDSGGYPDQNQKSQGYSSGPTSQSFSGYSGQGQGQSQQYGQPGPSQSSPTGDGYSSGGISGSYGPGPGPGPGLDPSSGGYGGGNGPENGPPSSEYGPSQIPYTATASLDIEYGPDSDPGPGYGIPPEYGKLPPSHDQIIKILPEEQTFFLEQHHDHYDHHHHHHHHSEPLLERVDLLPHTTYVEEFEYPHHTHTHSHTHSEISHISYLTGPEHHLPLPPPPYQFKIVPKIQIEIKPQDKGWQPIFKPSAVDYGPPKGQAQGGYDIKNNNNGTAQYGPPPNVTSTVGSKTVQGQKTQVQGGQRVQGQQGGEISSGPGQVGTTEGPFISSDGVTRFTTQRTLNVIQQQEREKVNRQQQSRGPDQQSRGPIVTNQVQGGQGPVQQGQVTGGYDYTPAGAQPKKQTVQATTTPPVNQGDQSSASESQSKFTDKNNSSSKVKALGSLVLDSYEVTDVSDGKFSFTGNKKGQDGSNSIIELPNQPVGQSKDGGQTVYLVSRLLIVDKNKTQQNQDVRVGESSQNQQRKVVQNQRNLSNNPNGNKIFYQQNRPSNNNRQQRPQQQQQQQHHQQQQQNRRPQASNQQQQFAHQQNNRQSVGAKFANRPNNNNNNGIRPNQQQNPNINTQIIQQLKLLNNKIEKIEERINTKQVNKRQTIKFQAQFKTAGQMVKKQFQNQSHNNNHNQRNHVNFRNQNQSKNA